TMIEMTSGLTSIEKPLMEVAAQMGIARARAKTAFKSALAQQTNVMAEMRKIGKKTLSELEADPDKTAVVIFGRSYNAFASDANMGIPHKFASRGVCAIPFDFLPLAGRCVKKHMYWGMGQLLLEAAEFVKNHPQLFATFITNFSCGPDSFIIGYFRQLMGEKPSLTLELDGHTADAGLETRIEAFLDIVPAYRQLTENKKHILPSDHFNPAHTTLLNGRAQVVTSSGVTVPITSARVTLLFPAMGEITSESLSAVFRGAGINAVAHPPANDAILKIGRANTSCKECLPLILTTGMLLNYVGNGRRKDEIVVYFMPTASGPCRFGQYYVFMEDLVKRLRIPDVAFFSLSAKNAYGGLESSFHLKAWCAVVVSDVMEDIRSMILANASNREKAMDIFKKEMTSILNVLEMGDFSDLERQITSTALRLHSIPTRRPLSEVLTVSLVGEIFVRRDPLSRRFLTERLAEKGIAVICAPVAEWILYSNYLMDTGKNGNRTTVREKLNFFLKKKLMARYEKRIKAGLSTSGFVKAAPIDIRSLIHNAAPFISPDLTGEAVLTIGSALTEAVSHTCGVIAIGPFGCMPNRLSESILNEIMKKEEKMATDPENEHLRAVLTDIEDLPFLAIESDGSPFPQLIEAKLESFCLRAERLHRKKGGRSCIHA
ncbi:MAG: activase, partial [Deltaproteobacteria bacterium]|nr:activase [Deltaproteobacteria bacterium]